MVGWEEKPLGELCEFQRGLTYGKSDEVDVSSNIVLRANNVDLSTHTLDLSGLRYISESVSVPEAKKVRKGSLLICTASGSKSHLGKIAYVDDDYGYAFGGFMGQITPAHGVSGRYLFHALTSSAYKMFIEALSDGVNINNLKFDDLRQFPVAIPHLDEQQRIVAILDEAFEGIATAKANAEKNLQNAADLFDCHLQRIDSPKVSLGELVNVTTGKLDANAAVESGAYPFFTCSREIYSIDKYAFDCEALLLAGNNAVGDFNVKHYEGKFNAYQRTYVITINEQKRALCRFLYFELLKGLVRFKSQSVGAGTKFLKIGMIKDLQVSLPEMSEQRRLASLADQVREELTTLEGLYEKKISALDELKKSLLHQAFTGQL